MVVLLWYTDSDYPLYLLAIVWLSFFDIQILITPLVSFGHCVVVLLWYTDSDYPFGIFWSLCGCPSLIYGFWLSLWYLLVIVWLSCFNKQILITPLVSFGHSVVSFFDIRILITPLVSFGHCVVVLLWYTDFDYPFGIFWPLCGCPSLIYRFWLPLWYLLAIVWLSFFDIRILITPLVSFGHCVVVLLWYTDSDYPFGIFWPLCGCPSLIYDSDYPFGIFWSLCGCPSLIYRFWLPLWYLLAIVWLSFFDIRILITPLVSFGHCVVVLLWYTDSDYPFGIFWPLCGCPSLIYGFWLPLWYLLAIVWLSFFDIRILITPLVSFGHCVVVLLWYTDSDYPFGIFWSLCGCPSLIYGFWLPLWYLLAIVWLSFFDIRILITPLVSFGHCVVVLLWYTDSDYPFGIFWSLCGCPSLIYGFWLPLWYLLAIVWLSFFDIQILITPLVSFGHCVVVLLWYTDSDYPFGIFWSLCGCHSLIYRFWLPLWYLLVIVWLSFFDIRILITPLVSFGHCVVVLLWYTDSDYPFGIFWPLCGCPSLIYGFWLPLWYLLVIVWLSFFDIRILITPLVSFGHCVVVLLWYTDSDYPFGIFWPLCGCPSLIYRFWLPLWYLLAIVWLSFFDIQILITPLVSFGHCVVVLLWYTDSDYPFGIFWPLCGCPSLIYGFWLPLWYLLAIVWLSFFDIRILITPLYLLAIVWLSFFDIRILITPLVSFGHCVVVILWILITPLVSFGHCVVVLLWHTDSDYPFGIFWPLCGCPSLIYGFWLPLWYLLAIVWLSFFDIRILITPLVSFGHCVVVLLWYTDSDYPFGIFWSLCCCPSLIYGFWLPLWYLLAIVWLSFFDIRILITPLVSFGHCVVVILWYTDSDYPFGIFWSLCGCPSLIYGFWLPLWYLLVIVWLSFFDIRILIIPLVSFGHCVVVLLWYTDSDYPFGIFWPLCGCPSLIYGFWLPLWYLLAIVWLSFFDIQILITPLVSFGHCVVVLLWYTDSDYPFGIFWPLCGCPSLIYGFWLPLWYLFIVWLSFFDIQILITPLVSFGHCGVVLLWYTDSDYPFGIFWPLCGCPSLIYRFWLPLWYLLVIVWLSFFDIQILITPLVSFGHCVVVLLWYTDSDYPFGIFWPLCGCPSLIYGFWLPLWYLLAIVWLSFFDIRILITPLVSFGHCVVDIRILITPLVSFGHCVVVLLWYTDSDYPFGIFWPLCGCPSLIYRFWLPLWYLLAIVWLSFFDIQILITPLVSFGHCVVVLLWYTDSDYPFGIFWPLCGCPSLIYGFWLPLWYLLAIVWLSFFDIRILITPLYLLAIVWLSFFDIRILVTPLVSFGHCVVVLLWYTDSDYPFGVSTPLVGHCVVVLLWYTDSDYPFGIFWPLCGCIFWPLCGCPSLIYGFWLPLWYILAIVWLSFLLTDTDYPFGIFWPLCGCPSLIYILIPFVPLCCPSLIYGFWLPLWYLLAIVWLSFFDIRILITPLVSFGHCVVVLLWYTFWFWLPLWYLLAIVWLSFFDIRILITPLVSFGHCVVVLLWYTDSDYPFGIFWPLCGCPSLIYGFWLPLWYLLAIVWLSFFDIQILITPLVSFGHCVVVLLWYTDSDYPFGIFWPLCGCPSLIYGFWLPLWYLLAIVWLSFFGFWLPLWYLLAIVWLSFFDTDSDYPFGIFWPLCGCPSLIYRFWLPLWYLLAIVWLSFFDIQILITPLVSFGHCVVVLLWYTDSDYPFGIFWSLCGCPSLIYGFWLPLWYLLAIVWLSFFDIQILITPLVSFGHCVVVLLWYTDSDYPFGIFWPLCGCPSLIYRFWLPLWYLLAIVWLSFFDIRILITPLVSFGHCVVVLLWYTDSDYPFGIFWPLCGCPSLIYGFWLPLWYLLAIVWLSFFDIQILITPLVSFGHCVVVLLWYTDSDYPFGIFWPLCGCPSLIYRFWLPLWYLLAIVWLSFFDIRILITPLVSFGHCVVVLLWYTDSDYPFGIFWPLCGCPSLIYGFWWPLCGCPSLIYTLIYGFWLPLWYLLAIVCGCPSLIYGFWLPLWYLLAIVWLSFFDIRILITPLVSFGHCVVVLLWYTDSDYPFGIFWPLCGCPSLIYGFWLPLWYLLAIVWLSFFDILWYLLDSDSTPLVSFGHCVVVLLWYTDSDYPFGIFWSLCGCPSLIYGFWLPLWYLLAIVWLSFFDIRILITPLVSFGHCVVVLLWYTDSDYPFGIFWPLCGCPSLIYGFWLPLWYLLAIVWLSFFDIRILITPLVSFGHCVVVLLWYTDSDYPLVSFGIVWLSCFNKQILITPLVSFGVVVLLWYTDSDYPFGIFWSLCGCPSLIYRFWLPLWYLLAIVWLSFFDIRILITPLVSFGHCVVVLLWYTDSDYPFGIFWSLCGCPSLIYGFWLPLWYLLAIVWLSFFDIQILITPLVSFGHCVVVLLWYTDSDYPFGTLAIVWLSFFDIQITPLVSFGHCVVVLLWYTDSDYPFGIFWSLCGCPSLIYRFWLPLWYLLAIVWLSFFDIQILITPLVSFGHCVVVLLWYTDSDYPFGIFWPLCGCPSLIYGFWLPLWYLLAIVWLSFFDIRILITPLVSFGHCVVVLLWYTDSDYPFGIFWPLCGCPSLIYGFWLPLWYLLAIVWLSFFDIQILITPLVSFGHCVVVLLWYTDSDYPFGIFWSLCGCPSLIYRFWLPLWYLLAIVWLSFFDIRIWLPLWYLLAIVWLSFFDIRFWLPLWYLLVIVWLSFFDIQILITPLVSFGHCVVVLLWYTDSDYPFGIFWPLCGCPSLIYGFWLPLWYLLVIVWLSFFDIRILITPLVSFGHCVVVLLWYTDSDYPFGIFWSLCGCPSLIYRFWLPLWYLLAIVWLSFFDIQILITPLVSFGHCVVVLLWYTDSDYPFGIFWSLCGCPSLIYGFWLPLWYLLAIVWLSFFDIQILITPLVSFGHCVVVLLWYTDSDYPFGIFWSLCGCPSLIYRFWLPLWYLLAIVWLSFFDIRILITPLVSFGHCVVVLLWYTDSDYPFGIFWPLCGCPSLIYRFWLPLWYLLAIVWLSFFDIRILITPLVSFGHCVVVLLWYTDSDYPFGIFWPLCGCPSLIYRFWLPLWYLLAIVWLSFFDIQILITPLVSFGHCVVVLLWYTDSDYPFGIFWPLCGCPSLIYRFWLPLWYLLVIVWLSFFDIQILITPLVSFGHCVVVLLWYTDSDYPFGIFWSLCGCPSLIYRFWLPLWYLLAIVWLSFFDIQILITPLVSFGHCVVVLLWYTDSDYPFGIFWPLCGCPSLIYGFWLPLWYLLAIVWLSFFDIRILITPLVSFGHCVVVLLWYTDSDYPFGIFWPLCGCPSLIYRFWLPLWYLLVIVWLSFFDIQILITPLVSFGHCVVVLLWYTDSDYPFGIFWPLCGCPSLIYGFWLPLWYLLAIVWLSFFDIRILITPLVSFGHCVVVLLWYTDSDYPFGIFWPLCGCPSLIYRFWLPLWYLLAIVWLSFFDIQILITPLVSFGHCVVVLLWYTDSDYPFGIFWSLCGCLFDIQILITPLVSFGHCVVVLLWYTILITPLVSFGHCVVVLLWYTDSDYPFGIFWPLCGCPSLIYGFWLPLWYLLVIVWLSFFDIRILITPLVSFGHCVVVLLWYTDSDYPFGIFWSLCGCPSLIYGFWLPLWYLLAIVWLSFFDIQILITPLVSFGHCVVVLLWYTDSDYPFGIFWIYIVWSLCGCPSLIYRFWLPLWYLLAIVWLSFFDIQILITPLVSIVWLSFFDIQILITPLGWPLCGCPSLIYGFWLPLWYLLVIVWLFFDIQILITPLVSFGHCVVVLLWYTDSDYPFGIFWSLCGCPSLIYGFWLPLWYLLAIVWLSFFDIQILITPLVSFGHCVVVLLWYTDSDYPFGIFWSLCGCPSLIYGFWLPLWYLLAIVWLSFFDIQILITPLVSFGHCVVVLLWYTDSDYPFGIFWSLCGCPSLIYRFWLPLWYLLAIVWLSFFDIRILITPLVSFGHCVVVLLWYTDSDYPFGIFWPLCGCPSLIYGFWLPLWYLLAIVWLSFFDIRILITPLVSFGHCVVVLLWYTDSDYPFGIFWPLCGCPSLIYRFWLPLWYLLAIVWLSFFDIQILITPLVSFGHCVVVLLWYTDSDYPFGIFWPLCGCPSLIYRFWLPLWYLLVIVWLSFFDIQILITPLVSFGHCVVVLLWYTDSDYPFGIFWSLCGCPSLIYRFWLPLWYLLAIVWLSFFDIQILITPLVSFGHCVVVLLWYTDSDYPFGIFWPLCGCPSLIYGFWLPLWYLLAIVWLSFFDIRILITPLVSFGHCVVVLLWYTDSDYPFGIFWPLCGCPSLIYRFWLPLWYLLVIVWLSFFDIQILITPLVSFGHCVVVLLWYTDSDYPFGIFWPLCGCPSLIYGFRLPLWYLLAIVWLSFFDIRILITPLVSFGHCVVVLLWYTDSDYPFGIFWPLCGCPSLIYRFWLPLWYLLAIVWLSFFDIRILITPLVSFGHCVVVLLWYTDSDSPFGIFWSLCGCPSLIYRFWLPLWYLLAIVWLSFFDIRILITPLVSFGHCVVVLLWYTDSDYPFGIFWPLCGCPSLIYGFWLPLWYLLVIVWLSFFDIRILITPLVSFGHCVVVLLWYTDSDYPFGIFWSLCGCPSLIYGFWLPLWYLLAIVWLSFFDIQILITPLVSFGHCVVVLLWYTDSDYPFGIFWPLCGCPSLIYRFWLPLWYLLVIVWLSFFDIQILITPLVSFGHCVVVLLWYTDSDYPFGIFWSLCGCPSLIYRFWLPLWYLLAIVWLSFFDIQILITPLVSFGHCVVVLLWYTDSDYPFGIFWPLCGCPSLIYEFWLPLWYLLAIVWLSFFDIQILITPLVSFGHCVVVLLWYTDSDYPFGIFWPLCGCPSLIYRFWLPLWYLLVIVWLSFFDIRILITPLVSFGHCVVVLLWYTDSDYPFGIFWPLCGCPSLIYGFWLPLWYLLAIVWLSFFDIQILITPLVSFGHCVVVLLWNKDSDYPFGIFWSLCGCPSLIYRFWLPLWYLLVIVWLSFFDIRILITPLVSFGHCVVVLLWYTDSDYPFGIFWSLCGCPSLIYRFWLPLWYLLAIVWLSFFDIQILITPLVSFGHCVVVLLWYTDFDYPFGIFWPLCGCPSLIYRFWLPLWYLLAIVWLSFFDIQILITPLVSFGHCLVVLLWYTDSDYPFGIFWSLCGCPSLIYGFWLPLWYLLVIVWLSFFDIQILITPLVSFGHCVVVLLWYTDSDYPFGIFWPLCGCPSLIYGFWLPLWYLLAIVWLSFFDIRILITPLFGHCVVVLLWYTDSDYPFGIFKLFLPEQMTSPRVLVEFVLLNL